MPKLWANVSPLRLHNDHTRTTNANTRAPLVSMQAGASLGHVSGVPLLTEEGGLAEWGALDDVVMVRGGEGGA